MAKQPLKKGLVYSGPTTPLDIDARPEPVMLVPGKTYVELPETHPIVANLIERGLLQPAPETATEIAPEGAAN